MKTRELKPGAILAEDVRDRSGRLLLPAGLVVRENHLKTLMAWGIAEVIVTGDPPPTAAAIPPAYDHAETSQRAESIIADIFRHTDPEHPFIRELRDIAVRRLADDLRQGEGT